MQQQDPIRTPQSRGWGLQRGHGKQLQKMMQPRLGFKCGWSPLMHSCLTSVVHTHQQLPYKRGTRPRTAASQACYTPTSSCLTSVVHAHVQLPSSSLSRHDPKDPGLQNTCPVHMDKQGV